ncbi:hypothetical protein FACS189431_4340 [Alphaproteobacteria bacterium]|nr:hypothetical protein FACS189431_4340 [Alphaproteobacteria bacterium]
MARPRTKQDLNRMSLQVKLAEKVAIALSTVADGDMRNAEKSGDVLAAVNKNVAKFLVENGFNIDRTVLVRLDYDKDDFTQYKTVDKSWVGKGMVDSEAVEVADTLATTEKNFGLFLPLADCLGAVIYDTKNEVLMVSHLGRHNTEQFGAKKSIEYLMENFGSDPADILIWLSPSAGKENYPLFAFDNRSLREVNVEQFVEAGIKPENITGDDADTTTDDRYYSFSNNQTDQRFAIVAKMV